MTSGTGDGGVADVAWHALEVPDVLDRVGAGTTGLTSDEATHRLERHGPNRLEATDATAAWRVLLRQFRSPLVLFLMFCAAITLAQGHLVDTAAITAAVVLNAAIGFWQERKAETEVRALQSLASPTARVRRDGQVQTIDSAALVPGDLVHLESGDRVPADLRLIEAVSLRVDESMLTGESLATDKDTHPVAPDAPTGDRTGMAFSGSLISSGRATGVVVGTGAGTELGAINELIQDTAAAAPLTALIHSMERWIGLIVGISALGVFAAGLALGHDVSLMFRTAVALVVSAIPEALPVVLTVAMSVGVARMARRNAIVRHLPSVETLGSTTVIGSDKTGTLTQNLLTVERLWTTEGEITVDAATGVGADTGWMSAVAEAALRAGALTNEAVPTRDDPLRFTGDAVDAAMAAVAVRLGVVTPMERAAAPVAHMPYEPELGFSQTIRSEGGRPVLYVKGAPDAVSAMCSSMLTAGGTTNIDRAAVLAANEALGSKGLRVIATARRELGDGDPRLAGGTLEGAPGDLTFLGLEGMTDPPRPGVQEAIAGCRSAGIRVMMITGDHPVTAAAIAGRLGLDTGTPPLTGAEIAALDDTMLRARLADATVAARVSPQDKMRIVDQLMAMGNVVAVTGDGVNDAPALRVASIGVAMGGSGTDVARQASDIVLTDDDFSTIVHAVEEGRVTFATIRKATFFLLSTAIAALLAVAVNVFTNSPLILLPVQMLWANLVTSGIQVIALAFEPGEGDELEVPPRNPGEGVLDAPMWWRTALSGVWIAVVTLVVYERAIWDGIETDHARSLALTVLVAASFFQVMNARALRRSVFTLNPLANPLLLVATAVAACLQVMVVSWPVLAGPMGLSALSPGEWVLCVAVGATVIAVSEIHKLAVTPAARRRAAAIPAAGVAAPGR
ncbi:MULTISPECIES: HAD-IC family P-type ATPase [unclassified Dietzia]|uniref:cation-translocating P-type ATPase n=1 Tax=unclassified Dietzia TaxID=2617939 RepID=UPI000D2253E0|nr:MULTISPECIES: HAD-IC family P-type ATPase [unclassified Dietzia]AVZ39626.1 haloacid dehalogenase [Dietzia sp. JS16-p6b]MBB1025377.1 HAD-IC family P-type ATPase [Dietzia sp. DQ12-76]MBB1027747.1 HAD-IC family P-type ATPase [Dietzia sp. DQ11-38-2]QGW24934.1 P-type HAD superfamily ATPase [Dietzia sp. DQ12-45-1b]